MSNMYHLIMPSMFEDEKIAITEFADMEELNDWVELNDFEPDDYVVVYGTLTHWVGNNNEG